MEDPEVVAAIVAGDPAGLAEAYDRYAMPLYSYCRSLLREPADAADAVQDTFLVATARLRDLRDRARLRSWLYAVARNECLRRLRAGAALSALEEASDVPAEAAEIGVAAERAEIQQLVRAAIDGLNPGERDVIELSLIAELDGDELAEALGVSRNHAHARLSRARNQLERSLGALIVARTGREACAVAGAIAAGIFAGPHPPPSAGPAGGSTHDAPVGSRNLGPAHGDPSGRSGSSGSRGAAGQGLVPSGSPGGVTTTPVAVRSPGTPTTGSPATPAGNSSSASPSSRGAGTLSVSTGRLDLVSVKGTAIGRFTLTASGGPVSAYSITTGSSLVGHVSVSPSSGSLAAGASVTITVTSTSLVTLNGQLTVNPGGHAITVVLSISL